MADVINQTQKELQDTKEREREKTLSNRDFAKEKN